MACVTGENVPGQLAAELESHRSYVLRLWKAHPDDPWQGELQHIVTGEIYRFSNLDEVVAFLRDEDQVPPPSHPPETEEGSQSAPG
jgi:hypothetical protein